MPGVLFFITAVMLLVADMVPRGEKIPKNMKPGDALIAGIFQGFSVLPGISRFGTGLSACLLAGLGRKFAVKYSMLMSVPAIIGGMTLEITKVSEPLSGWDSDLISQPSWFPVSSDTLRSASCSGSSPGVKLKVFALYCVIIGMIFIAVNFAL